MAHVELLAPLLKLELHFAMELLVVLFVLLEQPIAILSQDVKLKLLQMSSTAVLAIMFVLNHQTHWLRALMELAPLLAILDLETVMRIPQMDAKQI